MSAAKPTNNMIAVICIFAGTAVMVFIFAESRNDPGLRMAALVSASNLATALIAMASTMLTGKDLTDKANPADLPPGTLQRSTETVQTPPITIAAATKIENGEPQ